LEKDKPFLKLRDVQMEDCDLLWGWRNDANTRASAFHTEIVPYDAHKDWFNKAIVDSSRHILIIMNYKNKPVGQMRLDIKDEEAEVDIVVDKEYRGRGYGTAALRIVAEKTFKCYNLKRLKAIIKKNNQPSISAFSKAGFKVLKYLDCNGIKVAEMIMEMKTQ